MNRTYDRWKGFRFDDKWAASISELMRTANKPGDLPVATSNIIEPDQIIYCGPRMLDQYPNGVLLLNEVTHSKLLALCHHDAALYTQAINELYRREQKQREAARAANEDHSGEHRPHS